MIMTMVMVVMIIMAINDIRLARSNSKARMIKSGRCLKVFALVFFRCLRYIYYDAVCVCV